MSNQLATLSTNDLYVRMISKHQEIMVRLQHMYENRAVMTVEEIDSEFAEIVTLKNEEQADLNILKFRSDLQEKTLEVVNDRLADRDKQLKELGDIVASSSHRNAKAEARQRKREHDAYLTGHWAAVSARGNGRH